MSSSRLSRKKEHLILAVQGSRCSFTNCYSDIQLPHDCLTRVNPSQVDLSAEICGYKVQTPVYINAITGGALISESINRRLAVLAARYKLPMAVGSQMAGIHSPQLRFTYDVIRKYNPAGLVMANLSASASLEYARTAVEMVQAQVLQLHVNPVQEFIMPEGEWSGEKLLDGIARICAGISVPVVVKEVGFGIGPAQAKKLAEAGVRAVDVSGTGGTNFAAIEGKRSQSAWWKPFLRWGLPTPACVASIAASVPDLEILASGGITDGIKALKCLVLGAKAVGLAGPILKALHRRGLEGAEEYIHSFLRQLQTGTALVGHDAVKTLHTVPALITGRMKDLLDHMNV